MYSSMASQRAERPRVIEMLARHDIVPTQQRVQIAQYLFARPQHVSADQLLGMVNSGGHMVSKATVYNTLGLFAGKGLVREVIVDPNRVFYDTSTSEHHHFFNVDTGELIDIPEGSLAITTLPTPPAGTEALGVDVIIRVRNPRQ